MNEKQFGGEKVLKVFVVSISGEKTVKVCLLYKKPHPLFRRMVQKKFCFLIDVSKENLEEIKRRNCIKTRECIFVTMAKIKISSKKIGVFKSFISN